MPKLKDVVKGLPAESDRVRYLKDCVASGSNYRDKFKATWEEVEKQIRLDPPDAWDNKEAWMSKVYLPFQANASERIFAKLKKLLFSGRFFDASGVAKEDREQVNQLINLIYTLLDRGSFEIQNDMVLDEAKDIGTSFLKVLSNDMKSGVVFIWRSVYNCFFDPECGNDFEKARWWIDEYKRDIGYLIAEVQKPDSLYSKEVVQDLINEATSSVDSKADSATANIKAIDGTSSLTIPTSFKTVLLHEYWGMVKQPVKAKDKKGNWYDTADYTYEWRVITMANERYILRDEPNIYGFIPAVMMKLKPLKYETYGRGFLEKARGIQDLANSMVNLGMDSAKINAFDIIELDVNAVDDWNTIEYKPLATWHMRKPDGVKFNRQTGASALDDILQAITFLDSMHQDATGATRGAQGTPPLQGQPGTETLGEYQLKLQAIDEGFLIHGKYVESTYVKPLIKRIYQIILNKDLFSQEVVDRILGIKEIQKTVLEPNLMTGIPEPITTTEEVPKLDLKALQIDFEYDFKLIGLTQMQELLQISEQIEKIMGVVGQNPQMANFIDSYALLKRWIQAIRLPDFEEILKSEEQLQKEQQQAMMQQQQQMLLQQQQGGQLPPAGAGGGMPPQGGQ